MTKCRLILGILALGILAALILIVARPNREPHYQGRSLSQWLIDVSPRNPEQREDRAYPAIRAIGTNSIPYLLDWVSYEQKPSHLRNTLRWLLGRLPPSLRFRAPTSLLNWVYVDRQSARAEAVPAAFEALGRAAEPAIPALVRIMNDQANKDASLNATLALAKFSTNATSNLLARLSDPAAHGRWSAAFALGELKLNPEVAGPGLTAALRDIDPDIRSAATNALRKIAPGALTNSPPE